MTVAVFDQHARVLLLDACCLLNLCASRWMAAVLAAVPARCAAADAAVAKAQYVFSGEAPDPWAQEPVDLQPLIAGGQLDVLRIQSDAEASAYIAFAAERLGDGESMTCALAVVHGHAVASDDRRVARVLARLAPSVPLHSTPWLMKQWADAAGVPSERIRRALVDIQRRARFVPGRHDALQAWWQGIVEPQ